MARSAAGSPGCTFPKKARLLRRSEFLAVKASGRRFADGPLAASWSEAAAGPALCRVGLAVSSKVGNSVVRNRIKRRIREAFRHERADLPPVEIVVVARGSAADATVGDLRRWFRRAAARMRARPA